MNADRLHAILREVKKELETLGVAELLQQLQGQLQNLSNQPQNNQFQTAVAHLLSTVEQTLDKAPSNGFSPAWREALKELRIEDSLGASLARRIRAIVEQNQKLTPAFAAQQLQQITAAVTQLKSNVDSLTQGMTAFKIGAEDLEPGESEVGILIPRAAVENRLGQFAAELKEFEFIVRHFAELCTGHSEDPEIKIISSSALSVFLTLAPKVAASIASAAKQVVDAYKTLLDIRKMITDLSGKNVPEQALEPLKAHANSRMAESVEQISVEIVQEYSSVRDQNRKNEIKNGIKISLTKLANRIDRGYNLDVRIKPPETADAQPQDAEYADTVREASVSLRFMRLEGDPILSLPEPNEGGVNSERENPRQRRGRKTAFPSEPEGRS